MFIRVAVDKIEHPLVKFIPGKMNPLFQVALRYTVQWKYVQVDTSQVFQMHTLDKSRIRILYLGKR